jgi:hypothetical protein
VVPVVGDRLAGWFQGDRVGGEDHAHRLGDRRRVVEDAGHRAQRRGRGVGEAAQVRGRDADAAAALGADVGDQGGRRDVLGGAHDQLVDHPTGYRKHGQTEYVAVPGGQPGGDPGQRARPVLQLHPEQPGPRGGDGNVHDTQTGRRVLPFRDRIVTCR